MLDNAYLEKRLKRQVYPLGRFSAEAVVRAHEEVNDKAASWLRDPEVRAIDVGYRIEDGRARKVDTWVWLAVDSQGRAVRRLTSEELAPVAGYLKKLETEAESYIKVLEKKGKKARRRAESETARQAAKKAKEGIWKWRAIEQLDTGDADKLLNRLRSTGALNASGQSEGSRATSGESAEGAPSEDENFLQLGLMRYSRPWLRVHVIRKLTQDLMGERRNYAREILVSKKDGPLYVTVVEALYQTMQEKPPAPVRHLEAPVNQFVRDLERLPEGDNKDLFRTLGKALRGIRHNIEPYCDLAEPRRRVEPLIGGVGIGNAHRTGGTLGAIVWDRATGSPAILTNSHVLAAERTGKSEPCVQPAMSDGGDPSLDTVANLARWSLTERVDAAVAVLNGRRQYGAGTLLGVGTITGVLGSDSDGDSLNYRLLGLKVQKSGCSTGCTEGFVDGVGMAVKLEYPDGLRQFFDQIHIVPVKMLSGRDDSRQEVSKPGDSGAVWVDLLGRAVGLHFAGDTTAAKLGDFAVANRMADVVDELDVSLTPVYRRPEDVEESEKEMLRIGSATNGHGSEFSPAAMKELTLLIDRALDRRETRWAASGDPSELGPQPRPGTSQGGG